MKRSRQVLTAVLITTISLFPGSAGAQKSLPQVPITYEGDTDRTIMRRAQWIEEAKKEGELVFWSGKSAAVLGKLLQEFKKVYPFINGTFWATAGEESAPKVELEFMSGKHTVDVVEGSSVVYPRWRQMKIITPYTDIIPGIKSWPKGVYSRHGDWAAAGGNVYMPQYNTNLVAKTELPKSWEDLLDPKWKGQISLTEDVKIWMALALEEGGWGIGKTEQYLNKLKEQKIVWSQGHSAAHALLLSGEFKILGEGYLYHVLNSQKKNAPVDIIRVSPVVVAGPPLGLISKAPHPSAAKLFLEWLLSPNGLIMYEAISGQGAVYPGATTRQAKKVEGLQMVFRTEESTIKAMQLGLEEKYSKMLGVAQ